MESPSVARSAHPYVEQIREKIASVPGVSTVAVGTDATPPYSGVESSFRIDGTSDREPPQARVMVVGQGYFAVLPIPLLQARIWNTDENTRGDFIAIVNRAFADPLSVLIQCLGPTAAHSRSQRSESLPGHLSAKHRLASDHRRRRRCAQRRRRSPRRPRNLPSVHRRDGAHAQLFVRTQGDPLTYLQSLRSAIASVASDQQISNDSFTLNEAIELDAQYSRQRLFSILFGVFSAMALALVGIFSVVAYSVAQRTREFGDRLALGAPRAHVLWVAARIALVSAAAGIVIGLAFDSFLGAVLADWMQSVFAAGSRFAAAALLALSALLACLLPARHAMALAPAEALRYE